ncbi:MULTISPECIES: type II toxin-antitoxin system RelE/ParE family toxin [Pseudomonas]|jgi:proteic killer suppression protein|uniref:type II toxin-antitoxin system RelE/ParE family toxin n=1 Tax=Pseudomonas TaxID=286 RepID=UPI0018E6AC52|nr:MULTISPECIES: type II toxin-antitoxin system RelE/ParE family toxin [Pseudomonas]MBI6922310.1 type II toxin-antitoxin system RelE/ParE family toxin [Pseudomonas monteilii]MCE0940890.1 type II toxin-antitoxin system RelE/ParE family toxin [Pseudomonas kurunegalensis]
MIRSFSCSETEALFTTGKTRRWSDIKSVAERKLAMLDAASELRDLRSPPGNRLEALSGNRVGQHSIRVNDQWRLCFTWTDNGPINVEIIDYH